MIRRTTVLAGTFALVFGPGIAQGQRERPRTAMIPAPPPAAEAASRPRTEAPAAQQAPAPTPAAGNHNPRIAFIAPPPPAPQAPAAQPGFGQVTTFGTPAPVPRVHVLQLYYIPTVVLNDGRVLANFGTGRGYEQVLRQCPTFTGTLPPNFAVAPCFVVDAYGRYSVLHQH